MLIEKLEIESGLTRSQILYLSTTASKRYKIYTIPKRNGGKRIIAHPSRALKAVQRWISNVLISRFPVHQSAFAYKEGTNIRQHALQHANSRFTLRMDFINFFPSFSASNIQRYVEDTCSKMEIDLSPDDIEFLTSIATRDERLTIGAPLSPALTNAMMYNFDHRLFVAAREGGLVYTRYADDVFISSSRSNRLNSIYDAILTESGNFQYANLRINRQKTANLSRRYRRSITGLIVTPEGSVSIGRKRKREIKSLVHSYIRGSLPREELDRVRGLVAYSKDAEPKFYKSLCEKYNRKNLEKLLRNLGKTI